MPIGCMPRVKQRMSLAAPSIVSESTTGGATAARDSDSDVSQQVSDSRSGIEDEQDRMEEQLGGAIGQSPQSHMRWRNRPRQ